MSDEHKDMEDRLKGFTLTTAEIFYHLPDHPNLLQSYIWQGMDKAPDYPVLHRFLDFWRRELDGPLHSVRIGEADVATLPEVNVAEYGYTLH